MYSLNATDIFQLDTFVNTYIYDIFPLPPGIAVLSSDNVLRLLNPFALTMEYKKLKCVADCVTCCIPLEMKNLVAAAGRDGLVKIWDTRNSELVGQANTGDKIPVLSIASSQHSLVGGSELTKNGASILFWDLRKLGALPILKYDQSHSDDVTQLKFHPEKENILMSGSVDGLLNIFNTCNVEEEESLQQTINHTASIHKCGFLNEMDIFALSHDEKLSMYKISINPEDEEHAKEIHFGDLREVLGGEYVANIIGRQDQGAVLGIGSNSREIFEFVQLKNNPTWTLVHDERVALNRAHGSDIIRTFCFLDDVSFGKSNWTYSDATKCKIIVTGGEDGQVKAWKCI